MDGSEVARRVSSHHRQVVRPILGRCTPGRDCHLHCSLSLRTRGCRGASKPGATSLLLEVRGSQADPRYVTRPGQPGALPDRGRRGGCVLTGGQVCLRLYMLTPVGGGDANRTDHRLGGAHLCSAGTDHLCRSLSGRCALSSRRRGWSLLRLPGRGRRRRARSLLRPHSRGRRHRAGPLIVVRAKLCRHRHPSNDSSTADSDGRHEQLLPAPDRPLGS
jgi:hypothetical protein